MHEFHFLSRRLRVVVCVCLFTDIMVSSYIQTKLDLSKITSVDQSGSNEGRRHILPSDNVAPGRDSKFITERTSDIIMRQNGSPDLWPAVWS